MTLKAGYCLFSLLLHALITYLLFQILKEQKGYFIAAEIGIILSFLISIWFYQRFMGPLRLMQSGIDAIRDKDFNIKFVKTGSFEIDKLVGVYNEMIDSIRQERTQLQEQHYFLQKLIQASPAGIIVLDYDGRIADINPRAKAMLNIEAEAINVPIGESEHTVLRKINEIPVEESEVIAGQGMEKFKCEVSHFIHRGFHRKFILIQELSKEILAAEKRAYGKVIRMMAHEVNNSIGAINSILDSALEWGEADFPGWEEDLKSSLRIAIDRNNNLNQFMKNFAEVVRLPQPQRTPTPLQQTVRKIASLMEHQARERNITFDVALPSQPVMATIDAHQIEQALVNIVKNAMEAIEEEGVVKFRVETSPPALVISDNGPGIPPHISEKLFSPFFSTKTNGQGVGLTLVREILSNHGVQFSLKSGPQNWTTFQMRFQ